jgi:hypothetical protein
MRRLIFIFAMLVMTSMTASAQGSTDILGNLVFESNSKFIRPTKEWIPLKTKPSAKAPKMTDGTGDWKHDVGVGSYMLLPVLAESNGWYKVHENISGKDGWISKTNAKVSVGLPITQEMMNTNQCGYGGYDDGDTYRVYSPIGDYGLAVYCSFNSIRLGKLVDKVFVFKYVIQTNIIIDEEQPNKFDVRKELYDGNLIHTLTIGTNYCTRLIPGIQEESGQYMQPWAFDLSKLNDKVLLYLFKDVIEKNQVEYLYINSELLTGEYANYFI